MKNRSKFHLSFVGGCLSVLVLAATSEVIGLSPQPLPYRSATSSELSRSAQDEILAQHNLYRAAVNSPALEWSEELEQDAREWAQYLASLGGNKLVHASRDIRQGQGENLWRGTTGYFSPSYMVQTWGKGRQYFRAGIFPNVSKTGNWTHVGHYTQIVWKTTTKVGCAQTRAGGNDLLVCRYDPAGNQPGQSMY